MNPRQFLIIGGIILVAIGLLGLVGIIGPTPDASIFGSLWWFDGVENWAHLVLGIVALIVAYAAGDNAQKNVTVLVGILGVIVGLWGFLLGGTFLGANLQNPLDNLLHLIVGIWALWAWRSKKTASMQPAM